jgi:predicted RNase H-like HicB family nuclease
VEGIMLTEYIGAAMHHARYEILPDGTFYGEIPGFRGVYANAATLESCREELQEVLEGWIVLGLRLGHTLPGVDGITLAIERETA